MQLSTLYIVLTEITGLYTTRARCEPALQWGWPFLKQAGQGCETGWPVSKRVDRL